MAAPTSRPPDAARFDGTERLLHWSTAALVGVCLATAAALYVPALATLVGRRETVKMVHVIAGLSLPLPLIVARLGPWSQRLKADIRRLNRFDDLDRRWLRSLGRDPFAQGGRFNAGQKLNAAFDVGAVLLLLVTGSMMKWFGPIPLPWRTGATFVHDWTAFAFVIVLVGHVAKALAEREALAAMVSGGPGPVRLRTPTPAATPPSAAWPDPSPDGRPPS
ncbi:MAG: formate dehydrogenase subunit gamma [Actinomycetota bacterium]|jgi:formate dehydrogenase subunit gamma|nr:formate dehydrogenase subunit gamma [Actinomycetota bacterium]